jgi:hypothetical protein
VLGQVLPMRFSMGSAANGFWVRALALTAGLALAGLLLAPSADAGTKRENVRSIAYAFLINKHGGWSGPTQGRDPRPGIVNRILQANPSHLRITSAANQCDRRACYTLAPNRPEVRDELMRLKDAGIKLGAAINTARTVGGKRRTVKDVVNHACRIKKRSGHLYDWLFLDFMRSQPKRLAIANRIKRGKGCSAGGWKIVTNSSGYKKSIKMPSGAAAHAKRFSLLVGKRKAVRKRLIKASRGKRSVLVEADRRFIRDVKRKYPEAWPVLKLEAPNQTGRVFAKLSTKVQRGLLERWAAASRRMGFKVIHPLFVYPAGKGHTVYDSVSEGTYDLLVKLIARDG